MTKFNNIFLIKEQAAPEMLLKFRLNCCSLFSLKNFLSKFVLKLSVQNDIVSIFIRKKYLQQVLFFLKKHSVTRYDILCDIAAADVLKPKKRFKLVYNLLSTTFCARASLSYRIADLESTDSCSFIFNGAVWLEREVYDMFGIKFLNNKDLRRLLTDYGFKGHPLRKDFPLTGFEEVAYSDSDKCIKYSKVSLAQEFRIFEFRQPW